MSLLSAKFSGHQSFALRNTWLTKGVWNYDVFRSEEAMQILGVGKNMVDSIRYWCVATTVLGQTEGAGLQPTELGRRLFDEESGWDPYLEDVGSLWLLHHCLATNWAWATTIYYAYNELDTPDFTRLGLEQSVMDLARRIPTARWSPNTIKRDVSTFIHNYAGTERSRLNASIEDVLDCPLVELGLLHRDETSSMYSFVRGAKDSLPDEVVLYALAKYAGQHPKRRDFSFHELAYQPHGPGRVFKLDEPSLAERLERMADLTGGAWLPSETAGYRQVLLRREVDTYRALETYYAEHVGYSHAPS